MHHEKTTAIKHIFCLWGLFILLLFLGAWHGKLSFEPNRLLLNFPQEGFYPVQYTTLIVLLAISLWPMAKVIGIQRWSAHERFAYWTASIIILCSFFIFLRQLFFPWEISLIVMTIVALLFWLLRHDASRISVWLEKKIPLWLRERQVFVWGIFIVGGLATYTMNGYLFAHYPFMADSYARLFHAHILDRGWWVLPSPEHWEYLIHAYVVRTPESYYSQYLPGSILIDLAGLKIGNLGLLPAMIGGGTITMTYLVGRRLYDHVTALFGALLLGCSTTFILQAASFMEHAPMMFLLTGAFWAGLRDLEKSTWHHSVLLGLLVGYACITRPLTALGVAGPLLAVWWLRQCKDWRRRFPYWAITLVAWLIPIAFLLLFNEKTNGNPFTLAYRVSNPELHSLGFTETNKHTIAKGIFNQLNNVHSLSYWLFMWPISSYSLIYLLLLSGKTRWRDGLLFLPLVGLVCLYFFYPYQDFFFSPRFISESVPFLCLLSARGFMVLWTGVGEQSLAHSTLLRATLVIGLIALFITSLVPAYGRYTHFRASASGARSYLNKLLEAGENEEQATVFITQKTKMLHVALIAQVKYWGRTEYLVVPDPSDRLRYMQQYPERDFILAPGLLTQHTP